MACPGRRSDKHGQTNLPMPPGICAMPEQSCGCGKCDEAMMVRPVIANDLSAMVDITNWAIEHTPAHFGVEAISLDDLSARWEQTRAWFPWYAATVGDLLVGFAYGSPYKERAAYRWTADVSVYVHPNHHRRGAGKALYAKLIETLRAQGFRSLYAGITLPNPASRRLHESFGFEHIGTFKHAGWKLARWHDVGFWQLNLVETDREPHPLKPPAVPND